MVVTSTNLTSLIQGQVNKAYPGLSLDFPAVIVLTDLQVESGLLISRRRKHPAL